MPSFSADSTISSRLETHGRVHVKDQETGMAVKRRFGDKTHFFIMYGNVQLHGDEGRDADLDRVKDGKLLHHVGFCRKYLKQFNR